MTLATCQRLLKHFEDLSKSGEKPGVKEQAKKNFDAMKEHLAVSKKGKRADGKK